MRQADGPTALDFAHEPLDSLRSFPSLFLCLLQGDGPWDSMEQFDDSIPERKFDNFQFLSFTKLLQSHPDPSQRARRFALDALMELPEQVSK